MSVSKSKRWQVLSRDGFTCRYCGRQAPDVRLEVDHVEARAAGGDDAIANLVTACYDCNRGKKASSGWPAIEFNERIKELDGLFKSYLDAARVERRLDRICQYLVVELAYQTQQTEGDIWDWLSEELSS